MSQPKSGSISASSLETEFYTLSDACVVAFDGDLKATRDIGVRLAEACLLYAKLSKKPAVLSGIYKRAGFDAHGVVGDGSDFPTYVKALFRVDLLKPSEDDKIRLAQFSEQVVRNKADGYVASLERMYAECRRDPLAYQRNGAVKLAKYHHDASGIKGATAARAAANSNTKNANLGLSTSSETDWSEDSAKWLGKEAHTILRPTAVPINRAAISSGLNFSANGAALCIVYDLGNDHYGIVPAAANTSAIQDTARTTASTLKYVQGLPLRTLTEIISTQCYPKDLAPGGSRLNLDGAFGRWYRGVYLETGTSKKLAPRRLIIRKDDLLLSASDTDAGVATLLRPKYHILPADQDERVLDDLDLRRFEHWLDTDTVPAFTCCPVDLLRPGANALTIKSFAAGVPSRQLLLAKRGSASVAQVEPDLSLFVPDWTFTASSRWFREHREAFLVRWFESHASGNKLGRQENMAFQIEVTATNFRIEWEIDGTGNHPPHDAKVQAAGASVAPVLVSSKDLAPVLYNLPDLNLIGGVKVRGNAALLAFEFATEIGDYIIAVPTVTAALKQLHRNPTHLRTY